MNRHSTISISDILSGICICITFLCLSITFSIHFRGLYYFDINSLNIPQNTNLSYNVIKLNYDALIDYCSPFWTGSLTFPNFIQSSSGISHFSEVKNIFNTLFYTGIISLFISIVLSHYKNKQKRYKYLILSSCFLLILPIIFLTGFLLDFHNTFTLFHKILFHNDNWLFNPQTDPIISILPEDFFMHCGILIIIILLIDSLSLFIYYKKSCHKMTSL